MDIMLLFFILFAYSFLGVFITKRKFEEIIPLCVMGIVIIIYIAGALGYMRQGAIVCIVGACISLFLALFQIIHANGVKGVKEFAINSFGGIGFWTFLVAYILIIVFNYGRMATGWDEFSHWMDSPSIMTAYDEFGANPSTGAMFGSYPPAMSIFQYFFQILHKLCYVVGFSEWRCYVSYQIFIIALLMPGIKFVDCDGKISILKMFSFMAIAILTPLIFYPNLLFRVYIDPFVGICAGVGMIATVLWHDKNYIYVTYIGMLTAVLTLSKDVGLLFAIVIVIMNIANDNKVFSFIIPLISTVVAKLSWKMILTKYSTGLSFQGKIDFKTVGKVFAGKDDTYLTTVLHNYVEAIFTNSIPLGISGLSITYFSMMIVLLVLVIFGLIGLFHKAIISKRQCILWAIIVPFQLITYIIGMCVIYLSRFGEYEATRLASLERYLGMSYLPTLMIVLALGAVNISYGLDRRWKKKHLLLILCILMLLFINPKELFDFVSRKGISDSIEFRQKYNELADEVLENCQLGSKIYYIVQENSGLYMLIMKYLTHPNTYQNGVGSISEESEGFYDGDIWTLQISREDWMSQLIADNYDYVCLGQINDYFIDHYWECFENATDISEKGIYTVDKNKSLLVKVN